MQIEGEITRGRSWRRRERKEKKDDFVYSPPLLFFEPMAPAAASRRPAVAGTRRHSAPGRDPGRRVAAPDARGRREVLIFSAEGRERAN